MTVKNSIICLIVLMIRAINANGQISAISAGLAIENLEYISINKTRGTTPVIIGARTIKKLDVPLDQYLPRVLNQGNQGSCTAFAVAEALSIRENYINKRKRSIDPVKAQVLYSPTYLWVLGNANRPNDQDCLNPGISYSMAFSSIFKNNLVQWDAYPYPDNPSNLCHTSCPQEVLKKQITDRSFAYEDVILDVEPIKKLLRQGYPVCIATKLDMGFYNALYRPELNGLWAEKKQSLNEQHAMVIVDYNDDKNCFKVLDSHGPNLGDKGFIWLDYKLVNLPKNGGVVYGSYTVSFDKMPELGPDKKMYYVSTAGAASDLKVVSVKVDSLFKGKVIDTEGNGVPGVTIGAKGVSGVSTITNAAGDFKIKTLLDKNYFMQYSGFTSTVINVGYENKTVYENNVTIEWIKQGYYRIFNNLRFGIALLDHDSQKVLLSVTDDNSGKLVFNSIELAVGEIVEFGLDENKFRIKLNEIKPAGNWLNFFNPNAGYLKIELISSNEKLTQYF